MTVATDLSGDAASAADAPGAVAAAESAARAAGVRIRHLEQVAEFEAVCALYDDIWRPAGKNGPVTSELLRAMTKAGSYVGGAMSASPSSCTSERGRCCAASWRSPGPSTRWSGATRTST